MSDSEFPALVDPDEPISHVTVRINEPSPVEPQPNTRTNTAIVIENGDSAASSGPRVTKARTKYAVPGRRRPAYVEDEDDKTGQAVRGSRRSAVLHQEPKISNRGIRAKKDAKNPRKAKRPYTDPSINRVSPTTSLLSIHKSRSTIETRTSPLEKNSKTSASRQAMAASADDDENVTIETIKVTGSARVMTGGARIDCTDGEEIVVRRSVSFRNGFGVSKPVHGEGRAHSQSSRSRISSQDRSLAGRFDPVTRTSSAFGIRQQLDAQFSSQQQLQPPTPQHPYAQPSPHPLHQHSSSIGQTRSHTPTSFDRGGYSKTDTNSREPLAPDNKDYGDEHASATDGENASKVVGSGESATDFMEILPPSPPPGISLPGARGFKPRPFYYEEYPPLRPSAIRGSASYDIDEGIEVVRIEPAISRPRQSHYSRVSPIYYDRRPYQAGNYEEVPEASVPLAAVREVGNIKINADDADQNVDTNPTTIGDVSTVAVVAETASQNEDARSDISGALSTTSIGESIFSMLSASSKSSIVGPPEATEQLVNLLINDEVVRQLCEQGLSTIEPLRFERNLRRLLKGVAVELKKEAQTAAQVYATKFISLRARNSAHLIRKKLVKDSETDASSKTVGNENDMESGDSDGIEPDDEPNDLSNLEHFIISSKALSTFRDSLRAFVIPRKAEHPNSAALSSQSRAHHNKEEEESNENIPSQLASSAYETSHANDLNMSLLTQDLSAMNHPPSDEQGRNLSRIEEVFLPEPSLISKMLGLRQKTNMGYLSSRTLDLTIWLKLQVLNSRHISNWLTPIEGKTRIKWKCKCGHQICDDFVELIPGAAEEYKQKLQEGYDRLNGSEAENLCKSEEDERTQHASGKKHWERHHLKQRLNWKTPSILSNQPLPECRECGKVSCMHLIDIRPRQTRSIFPQVGMQVFKLAIGYFVGWLAWWLHRESCNNDSESINCGFRFWLGSATLISQISNGTLVLYSFLGCCLSWALTTMSKAKVDGIATRKWTGLTLARSLLNMCKLRRVSEASTDLEVHEISNPQTLDLGDLDSTTVPAQEDLVYLLLCYSEGKYATRLLQLDLITLQATSDKALFKLLKLNYKSMRGRLRSWLSLRTLSWIKFVHFELYSNDLVDVRKVDDIPPPDHTDYRYIPTPPALIPPVGDKHMMHLFQHPECAGNKTLCVSRFPKKLKEQLNCNSEVNPGWGLQFVEGWDWKNIGIVLFVFFGLGSLLIGVLITRYNHSLQDGFAVGSYMISFATVAIGTLQAMLMM